MRTPYPVLLVALIMLGCSGREMKELVYENGQVKERWYVKNSNAETTVRDGKYESWYKTGQKREQGEFVNGKKQGRWISWYENGQKEEEGEYVSGKKHGKWTEWDEDGVKEGERDYFYGRWTE
jgi:antitoxin component YwqK of YwqJK toxin-antitoxin module